MALKKYFNEKQSTAITASITADGYLELCQPNQDEEVKFHLTPSQAARVSQYILENLREQRSNWNNGESGDK